ncbi:MAG: hypothetical protein HOO00_01340 [Rhodospirillaceae bacterium]|jgi:hypothetical protein|nr:hypothetical protein [Rhodospirillaceae bacterium]MBT5373947.1 hypothetical protein [Rhodospirillaceae bacterium]MBT5659879.1 hypothetical protein [Rhodospirillaceae bacterium]MBT5752723.1 hypothetical protein [Rhodospirillaceae bacterium]
MPTNSTFSFHFLRLGFLAVIAAIFTMPASAAEEFNEKDWPCAQRLVPELMLSTVWEGPSLEGHDKWWQDEAVSVTVGELTDPTLTEAESTEIVDKFVETYKGDKNDALLSVFSGVFEKSGYERRKQLKGILKYVNQQRGITKEIARISKEMRKRRKEGMTSEMEEMKLLTQTLEWNTRVYDERDKLTVYLCEEPVLLEQRLGFHSRAIMKHLKK